MGTSAYSGEGCPRVMWADDDRDLLWLMAHALRRDGIAVRTVDHAPTCGEVLRERPAVLFLDVDLGDASGAQVCSALKRDHIGSTIPVVLISALSADELREAARTCGADGFITKPFLPRHIVRLAWQYLHVPLAVPGDPQGTSSA